jgi:hypothetical protein
LIAYISQGFPEVEPIDIKFCYENLANTTMEAETSHNLLPASWKPRKADCAIQSESEHLRTREVNDIKSQNYCGK